MRELLMGRERPTKCRLVRLHSQGLSRVLLRRPLLLVLLRLPVLLLLCVRRKYPLLLTGWPAVTHRGGGRVERLLDELLRMCKVRILLLLLLLLLLHPRIRKHFRVR